MGRKRSDGEQPGGRQGPRLTRRQLLTVTTAAALGGGTLAAVLAGRVIRFRMPGPGRAFFDLNGKPAWAIDTALFDGRPRLQVEQGLDRRLYIALAGAFFPGTNLPADFEAVILPGGDSQEASDGPNYEGSLVDLHLALGGLSLRGLHLGPWLAGEALAHAPVNLGGEWRLGKAMSLAALGRARATFAPDWSLILKGAGLASLAAAGLTLVGDELRLGLQRRRGASLSLLRGRQEWPALLPPARREYGSLTAEPNAFDQAVVELSGRQSEPARLTLRGEGKPSLWFVPPGRLTGLDGAPLRLPLQRPAYTLTYAGDALQEQRFSAEYADEPAWVQGKGAVLQLGRTPETPNFEWTAGANGTTQIHFRPALLAMGAAALSPMIVHPSVGGPAAVSLSGEGPGLAIDLTGVEIIRPADLLSLTFGFENMTLQVRPDKMPYLHPTAGNGRITVTFPPQHIAEEAVPEFAVSVLPTPEPSPPIGSRAAGPSTLLFETSEDVDFTLEALLSWERFTVPTTGNGTLEAPYKLFYALPSAAAWAHSTQPVTGGKWTELWHTRSAALLRMSATTTTDYGAMGPPTFETSPSQVDRIDLQTQSAPEQGRINVGGLMLSSLGAWMKANGEWGETSAVQNYFHHMAMGRDIKVVVIRPGHLMPFGHKATLVTVTERKFRKGRAYLHRKKFIVVREPVKFYGLDGSPNSEREFPFREVEIKSRVTPPLDSAAVEDGWFWVKVAGSEYPFQAVAKDWKGESAEFTTRLIFVGIRNGDAGNSANVSAASTAYASAAAKLRQIELQGQPVAYAPPGPDETAELSTTSDHTTTLDTGTMELGVVPYSGVWPYFRPKMDHAMVRVPALEQFVAEGQKVKISLHNLFVANEFNNPNKWEVFAKLGTEWLPNMEAARSGGIASPAIKFRALSRKFGAIGLDPATGNEPYKPAEYFGPAAKVIGALNFADMLKEQAIDDINAALAVGKKVVPTFAVKFEYNRDMVIDESKPHGDPDREVKWKKAYQLRIGLDLALNDAIGIKEIPELFEINYRKEASKQTAFHLGGSVMRILKVYPTPAKVLKLLAAQGKLDPGPQQLKNWHYQINGSLDWFALKLYFLRVYFQRIGFIYDSSATKKLKPEIQLDPEKSFLPEGPLTFLQMFLGKHPNAVSGSNPPTPEEDVINLGLSVRIPDFSSPPSPPVGPKPVPRWELTNVEPWFKIKFYLDGKPIRFALGISYKESPLKMFYWLKPEFALIGMAFFAIEFEPGQVRRVQALIEVGALLSIEKTLKIGILKGEISLTMGCYFDMQVNDAGQTSYEVTGFLRLAGTVGIKIVEVSLEIYLALTYKAPAGEEDYWVGTARITIKVKLWLLSFSWSYTYTQRLNGSQGGASAYDLPEGERPVATVAGPSRRRNLVAYCNAFSQSNAEGLV